MFESKFNISVVKNFRPHKIVLNFPPWLPKTYLDIKEECTLVSNLGTRQNNRIILSWRISLKLGFPRIFLRHQPARTTDCGH